MILDPIDGIWISGGFQPSVHSETASSTIFYLWVCQVTCFIFENPEILSTTGRLYIYICVDVHMHTCKEGCISICVYICMCLHICVYAQVYVHVADRWTNIETVYTYTYASANACISTCTCTCICICIKVRCRFICMYLWHNVPVHLYVYMYMHERKNEYIYIYEYMYKKCVWLHK